MYKLIISILILKLLWSAVECYQESEEILSDTRKTYEVTAEKRSAALYVFQFYSMDPHAEKFPELNYENTALTSEDFAKAKSGNAVVSFFAQDPFGDHKNIPEGIHRMWFNARTDQKFLRADLRLYRDESKTSCMFRGLDFNVTVFKVEGKGEEEKLVYVNSVIVSANFKGWIVLNVTECFQSWNDNTESNNGFKITVVPLGRFNWFNLNFQIRPESLGIVGFDGDATKHAFAVGYYQGGLFNQELMAMATRNLRNRKMHKLFESEIFDYDVNF